jgi:membrane protease YdiL (CAAX protease family)
MSPAAILYSVMLHPDRLGARINNWLLILIGGLSFFLYEAIQAPFYPYSAPWVALGIMLGTSFGVILPLFVLTRRLGIPFRVQFQIERISAVPALAVLGATLSLIPTLEIITTAMSRAFPPEPYYLEFVTKLRGQTWLAFSLVLVALAGAVPLAEELLFRGLFQRVLLRHSSAPLAVTVIALLFAAVHPLFAIPGVFLLAIFLGLLTLLFGNLSYSIFAHAVWNLVNLLILKLTPGILDPEIESPFSENMLLWLPLSLGLCYFFCRLWYRRRD